MLAEALRSSESDNLTNSIRMHQPDEPLGTSNEQDEVRQLRAHKQELLGQIQTLDDEVFGLELYKELSDQRMSDLKYQWETAFKMLSEELEAYR
jgi:hypothetical protein